MGYKLSPPVRHERDGLTETMFVRVGCLCCQVHWGNILVSLLETPYYDRMKGDYSQEFSAFHIPTLSYEEKHGNSLMPF